MTEVVTLSQIVTFTRDGEWGTGEPLDGYSPALVVRGTDFENVRWGDLSSLPKRYIRSDILKRKSLQIGDTLIETAGGTKDQPTGRTAYVAARVIERASLPLVCASFARFLRPDSEKVDPRFLFWKLQDEYHSRRMLPFHIQHTGVARFQYTQFAERYPMELFTLAEQKAIASVLTALDDKIELNRRMNETLEATARAIFKDWFIDFGPTRAKLERRAPYLAVDLWSLFSDGLDQDGKPEGWHSARLGDLAEQIAMGPFGSNIKVETFVESGVPVISGAHLRGMRLDDGNYNFVSTEHADRLGRSNVQRGDVVFTHAGNIGQVAIIPDTSQYERYILSQRQFYMRCNRELISPMYVIHFFHTPEGQHALLANASQVGVPSIARPATYLRSIEVCCPPKALLSAFDAIVGSLHLKAGLNLAENRTLAATRDILLPKLMSGEIRVKDAKKLIGDET